MQEAAEVDLMQKTKIIQVFFFQVEHQDRVVEDEVELEVQDIVLFHEQVQLEQLIGVVAEVVLVEIVLLHHQVEDLV
jgi:hypothetical protein